MEKFIGNKVGKVEVLSLVGSKNNRKLYKCICECGNSDFLDSSQLSRNKTPACKSCSKKLRRFKDLSGKKIGRWLVIEESKKRTGNGACTTWKCECACGKIKYITSSSLLSGHSKSCGCLQRDKVSETKVDLTGKIFGKLRVIERSGTKDTSLWKCKCSCGNVITTRSTSLYSGATKSCGCLRVEKMSGPNSRFWKGGITEISRGIKSSSKYWKWVREVKKETYILVNVVAK